MGHTDAFLMWLRQSKIDILLKKLHRRSSTLHGAWGEKLTILLQEWPSYYFKPLEKLWVLKNAEKQS
jgi:hypothetical protein